MSRVEGMSLVAKGKCVCGQKVETVEVNANPQRVKKEEGRTVNKLHEHWKRKMAFGLEESSSFYRLACISIIIIPRCDCTTMARAL